MSLCDLAGRIGITGEEYHGAWALVPLVGVVWGGPLGAILGPIGYVVVVRETGFRSAILPAATGTVACGFAGSLVAPALGLPTGIVGFFAGLWFVKLKNGRRLDNGKPTRRL